MLRTIYPLNRGWRFSPAPGPGWASPDLDHAAWRPVTLPHSNRTFPWHSFDHRAYELISGYRRPFTLPQADGRRVFVDFDGVMAAAAVGVNGRPAGNHRGGYVPFSVEITALVEWGASNLLAVEVDSRERADIPPFGDRLDYLTFGGIYRDVHLRLVAPTHIAGIRATPVDVLGAERRVDVRCFLNSVEGEARPLRLTAELCRDGATLARCEKEVRCGPGATSADLSLVDLGAVELWDLEQPALYVVLARLSDGESEIDALSARIGLREARFTPDGFVLNGRRITLRGLNRHQTYPYVGAAMPARVQRRDAEIIRRELKCNIVRTSHYPQSPHFLDRCDEIGLLVFEEMPGWQHIGDQAWQDLACRDVEAMVRRDWNHPSIILWGTRINESGDNHRLYSRTNAIARDLDPSRQTGGVRYIFESELLEDVFGINDFDPVLASPNHPLYLNSEFCGHMFPTKRIDNVERVQEHALRHARAHNQLGGQAGYAGGIGWCAFDYNTHPEFGSGDGVCYHGVTDIFRIAKPAAQVYRSQCDPGEEVVLEPCFHWAIGDHSDYGGPGEGLICSNCDRLRVSIGDHVHGDLLPDRHRFPHLPHPPFFFGATKGIPPWEQRWADLRIDGYIGERLAITRRLSARGADQVFTLEADDAALIGDGSDCTRVRFAVTDEFGGPRPYATGAIGLALDGPGSIVGENPFALVGGVGAVWIRATEAAGTILLTATHPILGTRRLEIAVHAAPALPW